MAVALELEMLVGEAEVHCSPLWSAATSAERAGWRRLTG
jgi:hypothetical protein